MKLYFVYIMASKKNGTLYIGMTNNLIRRVYEHKNGLVEGFTKRYKVHTLVYFKHLDTSFRWYDNGSCYLSSAPDPTPTPPNAPQNLTNSPNYESA